MGAWGEGSDVAICRVDGFGAGGCAFGWESRPAENEENFTFFWKKERIAQGLQKHFVLEKMSLFENSTRPGGELSLSLWQSWKSCLGAQVKLQGLSVSLDFCPRVFRLEGYTCPIPAS